MSMSIESGPNFFEEKDSLPTNSGDEANTTSAEELSGEQPKNREVTYAQDIIRYLYEKSRGSHELTKGDLKLLYETKHLQIGGQDMSLVEELRASRNLEKDIQLVLECQPEQITQSITDINENTRVYVGPIVEEIKNPKTGEWEIKKEYKGVFHKLAGLEHVYTEFPEGRISQSKLEIGGGDEKHLEEKLKAEGISTDIYTLDMMRSENFSATQERSLVSLIWLKVGDLWKNGSPTTAQLYARIQELGLELCPAETGPRQRLVDIQQPVGDQYRIGVQSGSGEYGSLNIFSLKRNDKGLELHGGYASPDLVWNLDEKFAFRLSQNSPSPKENGVARSSRNTDRIYRVNEVEGGFEVTVPGLLDAERETLVGISKLPLFKNREEAEQAADKQRERDRDKLEKASLEKTFGYFYRIDKTEDGKFRVTLPGLTDSETGYYVGKSDRDFDTWEQARDYFLQEKDKEERLTQNPILEISMGNNEKIAFSALDCFNPIVAPSKRAHEVPKSIEEYLLKKEVLAHAGSGTYHKTVDEEGWERKLYSFISSYLEKDGVETAEQLGIRNLDALTPRQAIELATQVVIDLTKYKKSDMTRKEETEADRSSALELLREGQLRRNNSDWEGNGVCRNFACLVKAVFESLKANQTSFSRLRNTYCLYEVGTEDDFDKKMSGDIDRRYKTLQPERALHAYNSFVTISREGDADTVIVDATWGSRNLETKKVENLDYTLTRMEGTIFKIFSKNQQEIPHKEEQLKHVLSFYMLMMEKTTESDNQVGQEEVRYFYTTRAVKLMSLEGIPKDLPKPFVKLIEQDYLKLASNADPLDIETLYKISQNSPDLNFIGIFSAYFEDRPLSDYHADALIFRDENLQIAAFEELRLKKGFDDFLKESPKFRIRMREVAPQLFTDFSPSTKKEDERELQYLIASQQIINSRIIDLENPSEESSKSFFNKGRRSLRAINEQLYDEKYAGLSDYQLVKQYDEIYRELSYQAKR